MAQRHAYVISCKQRWIFPFSHSFSFLCIMYQETTADHSPASSLCRKHRRDDVESEGDSDDDLWSSMQAVPETPLSVVARSKFACVW